MDFDQEFTRDRWALSAVVIWIASGRYGHTHLPGPYEPDRVIRKGDPPESDEVAEARFRDRDAASKDGRELLENAARELVKAIQDGRLEVRGSEGIMQPADFEEAEPYAGALTIEEIFNRPPSSKPVKRLRWGARFEPDRSNGDGDTISAGEQVLWSRLRAAGDRVRELWPRGGCDVLAMAHLLAAEFTPDGRRVWTALVPAWKEAQRRGCDCTREVFRAAWKTTPGGSRKGPKGAYAINPNSAD